jgi:hypothetical protein
MKTLQLLAAEAAALILFTGCWAVVGPGGVAAGDSPGYSYGPVGTYGGRYYRGPVGERRGRYYRVGPRQYSDRTYLDRPYYGTDGPEGPWPQTPGWE